MAIQSLDNYIAAVKQTVNWCKTASMTTVAGIPFSVFAQAGNPGAGVLNVGNTANGLVPTDATAGYPPINTFGGGATGYVSGMDFCSSVTCRITLHDRLFVAGAYAFNADITLASQPSFAARVPNSNYGGLQLWLETVTAFTGNQTIQINYLDQDGNAGDTGAIATAVAPILGRCYQVPLAAGDSGISQITRVRSSVSTVGTFNVMVLRPLWTGVISVVALGDNHDLLKTGLPRIYDDSALYCLIAATSTASGLPDIGIEIANA